MAKGSTGSGGKKRCYRGKSCGTTCISKGYFCIMELGPELASMLKEVRNLWRDNRSRMYDREVNRIEKLYKTYQKMPDGPAKERIKQRIQHIQNLAQARAERGRRRDEVAGPGWLRDSESYMMRMNDPARFQKELDDEARRKKEVDERLDKDVFFQRRVNRFRR